MLLQFIKKNLLEPAENYRPISILAIVSKVMERYVCNRLYCHVSQSITSLQHGFTRSRWEGTLQKQTDTLYLYFAKAFDTVDHVMLIKKLK